MDKHYSPQSVGSKRVQAMKKRAARSSDGRNCVKKLLKREISGTANWDFKKRRMEEKFRNFNLQAEFDTFNPAHPQFQKLSCLRKRSKIVEMTSSGGLIFALSHSGACAAIDRDTGERTILNISSEEVIRSLFYNKNNNSLITVSVYGADHFSSLKCRTTPIEYIKRGKVCDGFPLFDEESLKWPGFVEFDDVNAKVLTFNAAQTLYKVFDLRNYEQLYSINDSAIKEIKISPGVMLLIYERMPSHAPLKILNIEDGKVLKSFNHMLRRTRKVDFIEQFNEKL